MITKQCASRKRWWSILAIGVGLGCGGQGSDGGSPASFDGGPRAEAGVSVGANDAGDTDAGPRTDAGPASKPGAFTLLQANVGNLDIGCNGYIYKLCFGSIEDALQASIKARSPDIVALQELTSRAQCEAMTETDTDKVCHPNRTGPEPEQARRLVGAGYTIACASRNGYECVAVKTSFGSIEGCADGTVCRTLARAAPAKAGCDDGFTVSAVVIKAREAAPFTLVNAHPPSGPTAASTACREEQVRRIFEAVDGDPALVAAPRALVTGDFNLDPYNDDEASVTTFRRHVDATGSEGRLHYHSGIAEHAPPYFTGFTVVTKRVLDHVASDFATGSCTTLGEAPGSMRLDDGSGTDHRALACALSF